MSPINTNRGELATTGETDNQLSPNDDAKLPKKKPISERKVEANRRNAQKSTGPITATGKKTVSRNAVKHGIFAQELLIADRDSKETRQEFDDLFRVISEYYEPVGFLEELWVSKIAICMWRTRRVLRYEAGNIAMALAQRRFNLQGPDLMKLFDHVPSSAEINAIVDHLSLPQRSETDLIIRYGTMLDKELRNAVAELDKLQARRKERAAVAQMNMSGQEKQ